MWLVQLSLWKKGYHLKVIIIILIITTIYVVVAFINIIIIPFIIIRYLAWYIIYVKGTSRNSTRISIQSSLKMANITLRYITHTKPNILPDCLQYKWWVCMLKNHCNPHTILQIVKEYNYWLTVLCIHSVPLLHILVQL